MTASQKRAFLLVTDSVGIGGAPDADQFFNGAMPDTGANTLQHLLQARGRLSLPNMAQLGLGEAMRFATGDKIDPEKLGAQQGTPAKNGLCAAATPEGPGKDTLSGHWELAGAPLAKPLHCFPQSSPAFPRDLTETIQKHAQCDGILGNCHGAGTTMLDRFGEEHLRTGWPICYTSADSVFQIAAHEERFGLQNLLSLCERVSPVLHQAGVGRVIARPFAGTPSEFRRTGNRKDFAMPAPSDTLCDWAYGAGREVHALGKIGDIFSMRGIAHTHTGDDAALMTCLLSLIKNAPPGSLTFANFVEFDMLYGHRRDVIGYADALEWFDLALGHVLAALAPGDFLVLTADHGNDPTWVGTDHTRERVPVLAAGLGYHPIGLVAFKDIAASIADHLDLPEQGPGQSFLPDNMHSASLA